MRRETDAYQVTSNENGTIVGDSDEALPFRDGVFIADVDERVSLVEIENANVANRRLKHNVWRWGKEVSLLRNAPNIQTVMVCSVSMIRALGAIAFTMLLNSALYFFHFLRSHIMPDAKLRLFKLNEPTSDEIVKIPSATIGVHFFVLHVAANAALCHALADIFADVGGNSTVTIVSFIGFLR